MENKKVFSINLLKFQNYRPEVSCDKRVFFEAIIIKYIAYKKPFYYSKRTISDELGIKRDRAERILRDFKEMGILKTSVISSQQNGEPRQVTYYSVVPEKIPEAAKKFMKVSSEFINQIEHLLKSI